MSFQNYRQNRLLCKCQKSYVSVHPKTVNMLKRPKHFCNMDDSSFITFVHNFRKTSVAKTLS